jgi:3',5'-cyclic-nucleotide phosphodiesterase
MSDADSNEKDGGNHASQVVTPTATTPVTGYFGADSSCGSPKRSNHGSDTSTEGKERDGLGSRGDETSTNGNGNGANKGIVVMEKVRNLRKKPSRFRMNFWKRSKSASPPMPVGGTSTRRGASDDDGRSQ